MDKSPSKQLFEQIKNEGLAYIDDAIASRMVENYYLDFKRSEQTDYSGRRRLFESDKKNYAKGISAFGNSEGGVLIWGVGTGEADADYASEKQTIQSVSNFKSLLEGFTSQVTTPPHSSVEHIIIYQDEDNDTGYVITHIPKSSKRPFQVVHNTDFRYYIRAGSSSLPAPDNQLRSMFGQEPSPDVFIAWGTSPITIEADGTIHCEIGVILHNKGESVAKNVNGYIHIGGKDLAVQVNQNTMHQFAYNTNSINGMKVSFVANSTFLLGVEQEVQPLILHLNLNNPVGENGLQILALITADNQMSYRINIDVTREELSDLFTQYTTNNEFDILSGIFKNDDQ